MVITELSKMTEFNGIKVPDVSNIKQMKNS